MANVFVVLIRRDDWRSSEGEVADKAAMIGGEGGEASGGALALVTTSLFTASGDISCKEINHIPIYNSIPSPKMDNFSFF